MIKCSVIYSAKPVLQNVDLLVPDSYSAVSILALNAKCGIS